MKVEVLGQRTGDGKSPAMRVAAVNTRRIHVDWLGPKGRCCSADLMVDPVTGLLIVTTSLEMRVRPRAANSIGLEV